MSNANIAAAMTQWNARAASEWRAIFSGRRAATAAGVLPANSSAFAK